MAQKKITDLQLIAAVVDGLNFPGDDGIQSYRATALQLKNYVLTDGNILLPALDPDIFHGLTGVSAADDDYFPLIDTSDGNKTKKALVSTFSRNLYRSITSTDSLGTSDRTAVLSGASFTLTLPAIGTAGRRYKIIHNGTSLTQVYTLATTGGNTIGGVASGAYNLVTKKEMIEVEDPGSGTDWIIIDRCTDTGWVDSGAITFTGSTSNPTKPTVVSNDKLWWKRVGDSAFFKAGFGYASATGAATGSGAYLLNLPANMTGSPVLGSNADPSTSRGTAQCRLGDAAVILSGGTQSTFTAWSYTANTVAFWLNGTGPWGSAYLPFTNGNLGFGTDFVMRITDWQP